MTSTSGTVLTVSAVIPAYNRASTIDRAIRSVLDQSTLPDEVIVVDDGSADNTLEVVEQYGGMVRAVRQDNAGAAAARNRGVREATGEWIAFLDSDDFWNVDHLTRARAAIEATEGRADVYFANTRRPEEDGGELQFDRAGCAVDGEFELRDDGREWALADLQPTMLQSSVFRRSAFLDVDGIWEALRAREDTHLFLKMMIGHPACAIDYVGTEMTADAAEGERLSVQYEAWDKHFRQTVMVYGDLLARPITLTRAERSVVTSRLTTAHLVLARLAWRSRAFPRFVGQLAKAFLTNPRRFGSALRRRMPGSREGVTPIPEARAIDQGSAHHGPASHDSGGGT